MKNLFINESDEWEGTFGTLNPVEQEDNPVPPVVLGLDTASVGGNKNPNWVTAKTQGRIDFAIIRANWGIYPDAVFARDWPKIKQAGLVRGAYLFLSFPSRKYPKVADPVEQAKAFVKKVGKLD